MGLPPPVTNVAVTDRAMVMCTRQLPVPARCTTRVCVTDALLNVAVHVRSTVITVVSAHPELQPAKLDAAPAVAVSCTPLPVA